MSYKDFTAHFQRLSKLGQGSYGQVFLCSSTHPTNNQNCPEKQNTHSNSNSNYFQPNTHQKATLPEYFAVKKLRMRSHKPSSYYEEQNQPNVEDLREIQIMKCLNHENLIQFREIFVHDKEYKNNYYLLLPFGIEVLEFAKQKEILLTKSIRKSIIYQIINGIKELHAQNILHRDIKPDNIFLMKNGTIKVGDFSLSRKKPHSNPVSSMVEECEQASGKLSGNVTTRYYRAPQIMYGSRHYDEKIDIWSLGCTIAEIILHQPLFPGQTDINQLELIFKTIGYPQQHWPKASELPYYLEFNKDQEENKLVNVLPDIEHELLDLIEHCLQLDPQKRSSCQELLSHQYFADVETKSIELQKLSIYLHEKKIKQLLEKKH